MVLLYLELMYQQQYQKLHLEKAFCFTSTIVVGCGRVEHLGQRVFRVGVRGRSLIWTMRHAPHRHNPTMKTHSQAQRFTNDLDSGKVNFQHVFTSLIRRTVCLLQSIHQMTRIQTSKRSNLAASRQHSAHGVYCRF